MKVSGVQERYKKGSGKDQSWILSNLFLLSSLQELRRACLITIFFRISCCLRIKNLKLVIPLGNSLFSSALDWEENIIFIFMGFNFYEQKFRIFRMLAKTQFVLQAKSLCLLATIWWDMLILTEVKHSTPFLLGNCITKPVNPSEGICSILQFLWRTLLNTNQSVTYRIICNLIDLSFVKV